MDSPQSLFSFREGSQAWLYQSTWQPMARSWWVVNVAMLLVVSYTTFGGHLLMVLGGPTLVFQLFPLLQIPKRPETLRAPT